MLWHVRHYSTARQCSGMSGTTGLWDFPSISIGIGRSFSGGEEKNFTPFLATVDGILVREAKIICKQLAKQSALKWACRVAGLGLYS
eukprot:4114412-Ditylum_brightwellii.AAC.1